MPALRALARAYPAHRRLLACPAVLAPLVELSGAIDEVVPTAALEPVRAPDAARPEVAVNLHGRGPQSHRVLLALEPERLIAFRSAEVPESTGMPAWRADEHEVARWCRLLGESGIAADPADLDLPRPAASERHPARGATLLHPGAASPSRRWPAERFAAVARAERAAGRDVVVSGGADEVALARAVAEAAGLAEAAVFAGRTDLAGLAALVAAAGRVICGDTGVAHLATAFRVPSVVLFGPVPPAHWGPPPERPWHRALWTGRAGDPHGTSLDQGLAEISVEDVRHALAELAAVTPA